METLKCLQTAAKDESKRLLFYTYPEREETLKKWVVYGLLKDLSAEEGLYDLKSNIEDVTKVTQMTRSNNLGLPVFLVFTGTSVTLNQFRGIIIFHHRVKVEKYSNRSSTTQKWRESQIGVPGPDTKMC